MDRATCFFAGYGKGRREGKRLVQARTLYNWFSRWAGRYLENSDHLFHRWSERAGHDANVEKNCLPPRYPGGSSTKAKRRRRGKLPCRLRRELMEASARIASRHERAGRSELAW